MDKKPKGCGHGKTFEERCIECELVSAREGLRWAKESVEKYSERIVKLEVERGASVLGQTLQEG